MRSVVATRQARDASCCRQRSLIFHWKIVDWETLGPVGLWAVEVHPLYFATVFWLNAVPLGKRSQALLTISYRSTGCLCRAVAPA